MAAKAGMACCSRRARRRRRHVRCLLLDGVQPGDSPQRFRGHRAVASGVHVEDVRPKVGVPLPAAGIKLAHGCFIGMQATSFPEQLCQTVGQRVEVSDSRVGRLKKRVVRP